MEAQNNSTTTDPKPKLWIIHCVRPGCMHAEAGPNEWTAVHRLGEHIISAHTKPYWTRQEN